MPKRKTPLISGQIYHVFNKGIDGRETFTNKRENKRAITTISYYRFENTPIKLSHFLSTPKERKQEILDKLEEDDQHAVQIICFCLMSNHYHLLLKQVADGGISRYMAKFQNSYTRYFNLRHKRKGPLFNIQFKARRIENEEQLIHVNRYIHLNPYSSFVVDDIKELLSYPWSSLPEFIDPKADTFCEREEVLSLFGKKKYSNYKKFVLNQRDYQRKLKTIRRLIIE